MGKFLTIALVVALSGCSIPSRPMWSDEIRTIANELLREGPVETVHLGGRSTRQQELVSKVPWLYERVDSQDVVVLVGEQADSEGHYFFAVFLRFPEDVGISPSYSVVFWRFPEKGQPLMGFFSPLGLDDPVVAALKHGVVRVYPAVRDLTVKTPTYNCTLESATGRRVLQIDIAGFSVVQLTIQ